MSNPGSIFHSLPNDYISAGFITCSYLLHGETSQMRVYSNLAGISLEYLINKYYLITIRGKTDARGGCRMSADVYRNRDC